MCRLLLFAIASTLCTCVYAQTPRDLLLDSLRLEMQALAAQDQTPGFAAALVTADGTVYEEGFGFADIAKQRPYTPHTTQNIGSISKTFIGLSLLQAEREGILSMEDPINKYLPFKVVHPRYPNRPILLKHLATHTAGISDDKFYDTAYSLLEPMTVDKGEIAKAEYKEMIFASGMKQYPLGEYLRRFFTEDGAFFHKKNFTKQAPGERHVYSNVGAALAAYVLECAAKKPFPAWTEQYIFQPLGMDNTGWAPADVDPTTAFQHYFSNRKPMPDYILSTYPDGGLRTSIHQLGLYCSAIIEGMEKGNELLPKEGYQRWLADSVRVPGDEAVYGYFLERMDSGFYGHSGGDPGITTLMYINEENNYGHLVFISGTPQDGGFFLEALTALIRSGRKLAALEE
ncbi:MAG: serine hydrolase domain-containing protein [Bacteroidota bacterium]